MQGRVARGVADEDAVRVFTVWQRELIEESRVAHFGTISRDGRPHLVPVCYALSGGRFWVPIDAKPKTGAALTRVRNIGREPRAALLIDRYDEEWARLAWVRIDCRARVLARGESSADPLAALRARYRQYESMDLEERPLIELSPERVTGWRWDRSSTR